MSSDGKEDKEKEREKEKEKETENKREKESKEEVSENRGATGGEVEEDETDQVTFLQALLKRFGLVRKTDKEEEEEAYLQVLDEVTFAGIAKYIQSDKCKNIVVMAGAGISTAAGIPDFRSPGSGLYDNLQQYNLPYPEAIFEIGFFCSNPEPFFKLAKELYPGNFKPTTSHYFIRLLNEKGLLLRHYTQNIDTLERIAEIPGEKLVEAHGTFYTAHCLSCRKSYTQDWIKHEVFADKIPTCEGDSCDGVVKPDIVFFGESLPDRFSTLLSRDMPKCDLLIIMGTSLAVQPFASLVDHVSNTTPRLLINREKCGQRQAGSFFLFGGGAGLKFDDPKNYRDVAWLGSCDEGCLALADLLGWKEELIELVDKEHKKIDKESTESAQLKENDKRDLSEGSKNDVEKVELNLKVKETDSLKESSSKELECNKCEVNEGKGEKHECEETSNKKKDELDQTKDVSTDEDSTKSV